MKGPWEIGPLPARPLRASPGNASSHARSRGARRPSTSPTRTKVGEEGSGLDSSLGSARGNAAAQWPQKQGGACTRRDWSFEARSHGVHEDNTEVPSGTPKQL